MTIPAARTRTAALLAGLVLASLPLLSVTASADAQLDKMRATNAANAAKALEAQGGSRIVFRVDAAAQREAVVSDMRDDLYRTLREGRIPYSGLAINNGGIEVKLNDARDRDRVLAKLVPPGEAKFLQAKPPSPIDVSDSGGVTRIVPTPAAIADNLRDLVGQSVDMIEQRLRNNSLKQAAVLPDGADRIRVLLPGVTDPDRVTAIFAKKVRVSIRLVDVSMSVEDALKAGAPSGADVLYGYKDKQAYLVLKDGGMDGDDIIDASPGFSSATREPIASFRFNGRGTRRFAHITAENIGKPFAIVLDDKVLSAPIIREPITGGSGQISGNFTLEDANTVAMMLRAGALPGRLTVVEQQVVEPAKH
ncbi:preprotein translocase subunit SecD [Bradyrhizobium guangdongense]|uniref:SecDF P1 head subdomain-containing protein n=1 Tax=Bradyrhizobium guangdongense TaxID=1325090 RepID=UPI00112DE1A5|nr:preprotein translocase subunit SecD [Bradyrhizobium guangdongense]TPQ30817.1 preprotein translocase subunit SecD [Bradyrhizobium guangdongense]